MRMAVQVEPAHLMRHEYEYEAHLATVRSAERSDAVDSFGDLLRRSQKVFLFCEIAIGIGARCSGPGVFWSLLKYLFVSQHPS